MSPAGISTFCGDSDADTVLLKLSAHNMSQLAVVGEFRPARDILVIDMTALPEFPSIFEDDVAQRYDTLLFLKRLRGRRSAVRTRPEISCSAQQSR
jgi:hypothetical protein